MLVRQVMDQGENNISFGWQGGEPTLMGISFFKKAVEFQQKFQRSGQHCGNGLQTNGILIDSDWARFFRDTGILVGLSLDGPEFVHDHYRRFSNGQPTWSRVIRARDILLEADVDVNALIVVNDHSVRYPDEIYTFHKENGLKFMQFIPCVEFHPNRKGEPAFFTVSPELYGRFLIRLFNRWHDDFIDGKPSTYIRWFESLFFTYVHLSPPECTLLPECGIYTVIEHNGDIYACDFFVHPKWRLGNIIQDSLSDCLNSPLQNKFGSVKSNLPDVCQKCPWLVHCQGGCPKNRVFHNNTPGLNYLCQSYQMFFKHADPVFRKMAEIWQIQQKKQKIKEQIASGLRIRRNEPCPCGSGKKFKQCCGKE